MTKQAPMGPHAGQPILSGGAQLSFAKAAMIMVHGRGASADDILGLAPELQAEDFAYLAPQAAGHTWYPNRFLAPIESNEPGLSSALSVLAAIEAQVIEGGIRPEAVFLLGFSQGACLVLEYAARNARRFGGIIGLSGGLVGTGGDPAGLPRVTRGCADLHGVQRRGPAHSPGALPAVGGGLEGTGGKRHGAPLSEHGAHGQRGRGRRGPIYDPE